MGAKVALAVSAMVLVFVFLAAPFVAHDELAQAMGIHHARARRKAVAPIFGERAAYVRVSHDHGRVVLEAEVPDRETRSELLNAAATLYGRDQFVDLVEVVPGLRGVPYKKDIASVLPPALAIMPDTVVNLEGARLSVQGAFASPERKERYLKQLQPLKDQGVEVSL